MAAPNLAPFPVIPDTTRALEALDYEPTKLQVVDSRNLSSVPQDGFTLDARRYTLDDGTRYDAQIFHPDEPKFNVALTYTTPWCTDLGGFNQILGERAAEHRMVAIGISPERLRGEQLLRRFGSLTLEHDVHAQLAILNHIDKEARSQPGVSINVGYSRGAMVGFGVNAYANLYDRDIVYSDFLDPCLAHAVTPSDVTWSEIPGYLGREVWALAKGLAHSSPRMREKMARSAAVPSACFWLQQLAVGKALFDGQAGEFITEMYPDTVGHVTLYTSSRFNHADDYQRVLGRYPNMVVRREAGYHLTGVEPRVRDATLGRLVLAQNLLADNAAPAELAGALRTIDFSLEH